MEQPIRFFEGRFGRLKLLQSGETAVAAPHADVQVLALVAGPELRCNAGDGAATLTRDGLLLVNPGVPLAVAGGEGSRYVLYQGAQEWLGWSFPAVFGPSLPTPFPHLREDIKPRIRRLIDTLDVEMRNDRFLSPERLEFMAQELVLSIVEGYLARRRPAAPLWRGSRFADIRIRDALALLRAKPNKELNMDVVAEKVGLSRSRFYDLFQVCTGLSPRDYLDQLCVETAIAQLASAGTKIAEVSADLGFSAQSNFTRFFLHQVGVPPSEYRRAVLRNIDAAT
jgi:AraC-like DNA-binding protein